MARVLRDYSTKRFSNPLFQRRFNPVRGPSGLRRVVIASIFLVILGVAAWFFLFSSFFRVVDIAVSGVQRLSVDEVRAATVDALKERRWKILPGDDLITLSESDLASKLADRFVLESAEVTKRPPRGLDIVVRERVSSILFAMPSGTQALLDLNGAVIRTYAPGEAPPADALAHRLIDDKDEPVEAKERVMDPAAIQDVIAARETVKSVWSGALDVSEIHVESKRSHTLRLTTGEGWSIYVDIQQPLRPQLENAETVVRTKVGNDRPKLDYVDARFNEKIFFKLR